jgi:uncharacterized protein (UPF0332 family)
MAASGKKKRIKEARELLSLSKEQLDDAQMDWWEPAQPASCVTNTFYAYENAISAAIVAVGRARTKKHHEKALLAKKLFDEQRLKTDVSDTLRELNEVRKDVQYGEAGGLLAGYDLESMVNDLESFVQEVEALIDEIEGL